MTPQRELGAAAVACLGGAAIAIYGATRVWSIQITERPGLTSLRATTTGAAHQPWLIGLALVALAGAGALLATRGLARRGLGALLAVVGAALIVAAITGRASLDAGAAGAAATFWPIACAVGGALVAWGGQAAARHGHRWPAMGSRYERRPASSAATGAGSAEPSSAGLGSSGLGSSGLGSAGLGSSGLGSAGLGSAGLASSGPASAGLASSLGPASVEQQRAGSAAGHLGAAAGSGYGADMPRAAGSERSGPGDGVSGDGALGDGALGPGASGGGVSGEGALSDRASGDRASSVGGALGDGAARGDSAGLGDRVAEDRTADGRPAVISPVDSRAAWDALDRGDDPT